MIYQANELYAKLDCLTLAGQDTEGELEWIGTTLQWGASKELAKQLLKEANEKPNV